MARKVWFQLVDAASRSAYGGSTADSLRLPADAEDIADLRDAVKAKYPNKLVHVDAGELLFFADRAAYDKTNPQPLNPRSPLTDLDTQATVIVVVPTLSQPSFAWREPKRLVCTLGAEWDFQNSMNLGAVASAISDHYEAWRRGATDKGSHPLFMCLDGPGTGKSRLLGEFPTILQQQLFGDERQGDPAMEQLLRKAYTFKVTFENGIYDNHDISGAAKMIGTRMLYQLQDSAGWGVFRSSPADRVVPEQVLTTLSAITGTDLDEMCVILCVDSLQKLQHEHGSKTFEFYQAIASLCELVNASKCWVIALCSATVYQPVSDFVADSPHWRVMLQTTPLVRPTIRGEDVFDQFVERNGALVQLFVNDMGGHGRALEQLFKVMQQKQGKAFEFIPMMYDVLAAIRLKYPGIVDQMDAMKKAFLAVISHHTVDQHSRFGSLTLDQVISCGLIQLDETRLKCPFVLYMLLKTSEFPGANMLLLHRQSDGKI